MMVRNNILGYLEAFAQTAKNKIPEPAFDLICSYYDFVQELTTYTVDENENAITPAKDDTLFTEKISFSSVTFIR